MTHNPPYTHPSIMGYHTSILIHPSSPSHDKPILARLTLSVCPCVCVWHQDASCVYSPVPSSLPLPSLQASPVRKRKLRKHSKTTR